jgi:enoyl-[acyl-carrier protein] reductase I
METEEMTEAKPFTSDLLKGKKGLVLGVANKRSIAWGIARALKRHGADLAFTYQGERIEQGVRKLAGELDETSPVYPCDVTNEEQVGQLMRSIGKDFGSLQFCVCEERRLGRAHSGHLPRWISNRT